MQLPEDVQRNCRTSATHPPDFYRYTKNCACSDKTDAQCLLLARGAHPPAPDFGLGRHISQRHRCIRKSLNREDIHERMSFYRNRLDLPRLSHFLTRRCLFNHRLDYFLFRQHCLYFRPLPHGHGEFRPTFCEPIEALVLVFSC